MVCMPAEPGPARLLLLDEEHDVESDDGGYGSDGESYDSRASDVLALLPFDTGCSPVGEEYDCGCDECG